MAASRPSERRRSCLRRRGLVMAPNPASPALMFVSPLAPHFTRYINGRRTRREISPGVARWETAALRRFAEVHGRRPVIQLGGSTIERWFHSRRHLAPWTLRGEFSIIRRFCRWLLTERIITKDPTTGMRAPRVPTRQPRALRVDQVATVLDASSTSPAKEVINARFRSRRRWRPR
jgi:site-specific recombinase XerC